jgi:integrase
VDPEIGSRGSLRDGVSAREMDAAKIEDGRLLRPLSKSGKLIGDELGDWAVWSVVEQSAKEIGIERFGAHDLRRTCAKLCRKNGGDLEQIKFLLGHSSIQTFRRRSATSDLSRRSKSQSMTIWD